MENAFRAGAVCAVLVLAGCAGIERAPVAPATGVVLDGPAPLPPPRPAIPVAAAPRPIPPNPAPPDHAAYRREIRDLKLVPGWSAVDTKHYLVLHADAVDANLLRDICDRIERVRREFLDVKFPLPAPEPRPLVVRVCKDRDQFMAYGAPGGSSGYVDPVAPEAVLFEDASSLRETIQVAQSLVCAAHLTQAVGRVRGYVWFRVGLSRWAATLLPERDGGLAPDARELRRQAADVRRRKPDVSLADVLASGDAPPAPASPGRGVAPGEFQDLAGDVIDFLFTGPDPAVVRALDAYYSALLGGASNGEAVATAFAGIDLAALDVAWRAR